MKPTLQQTQLLQKHLRDTLNYRENFEEIYDHILSAVENDRANVSFEEAVNTVINNDFGGANGLLKIEKEYYSSAVYEVIGQQWQHFMANFKFPQVLYSLLLWVGVYYSMLRFTAQSYIVVGLIFALIMVPGIFVLTRYFKIGYVLRIPRNQLKIKL